MKKEQLINNFSNLISQNKMFQAIILDGEETQEVKKIALDIARMFFCELNSSIQDQCNGCKRFNNNVIMDFVCIGNGSLVISKAEIQDLILRFSVTASEKYNKKVYLIDCAENMKTDAANSMLKFLEEPPENTFAILLTKNRSEIMSTIKSRCKIFVLERQTNQQPTNLNSLSELFELEKDDILLKNNVYKKMDKSELIELAQEAYHTFIIKQYPQVAEIWLMFINDLKFSVSKNLSIDNWLISLVEVL